MWAVRPGGGQGSEIFGSSEAGWYFVHQESRQCSMVDWSLGTPLPFFLLDRFLLLHTSSLYCLPLTLLLQLTSCFLNSEATTSKMITLAATSQCKPGPLQPVTGLCLSGVHCSKGQRLVLSYRLPTPRLGIRELELNHHDANAYPEYS